MAKFIKRSGGDNKRKRTTTGKGKEDKSSEPGYKAKRSFTRNKSYRESGAGREESPRKTHDRPFRKDYSKEGRSARPARAPREGEKTGADEFKKRPFADRDKRSDRGEERPKRTFRESEDRPRREARGGEDRPSRPERRTPEREDREGFKKDYRSERPERRSSAGPERRDFKKEFSKDKPFSKERGERSGGESDGKKRRFSKPRPGDAEGSRRVNYSELEEGKAFSRGRSKDDFKEKKIPKKGPVAKQPGVEGQIRLNKYLSNAGIASRREADTLIQSGAVKVNGVVVDQLGYKINPGDKVTYGDEAVKGERKVYMLLNKPKDYITTMDDPQERKTVMDLVRGACKERVYPVGRLDRNTTGLLLLTNDGELTTKLTHPKFGIKKVYHVSLNKGLKADDFTKIVEGVEMEDGMIKADDVAFVGEGKKEVGIEIHSGRNRVVRRLFEHLGYDVLKLDRVVFAGLTKKDLPRGKHRFLTAKEISFLKMIG